MTTHNYQAFWHLGSYNRLMQEQLPHLLAERLPLIDYQYRPAGTYTAEVSVTLTGPSDELTTIYTDLPCPDEEGFFNIKGKLGIIRAIATDPDLTQAEIRCVGEQLYTHIEARLGEAPPDMAWDESLIRAWLPLNTWLHEYLEQTMIQTWVNDTNWLDKMGLTRQIYIPNRRRPLLPGHFGRIDPFETPEGPNLGSHLSHHHRRRNPRWQNCHR